MSSPAAADSGAHVAVLIDPESFDLSEERFAASLEPRPAAVNDTELRPPSDASDPANDAIWRDEVSSRVDAYRARRGRPRRAEASLSLDFEQEPAAATALEVPRPQLHVVEAPKVIEFPRPAEPPPPLPYVEELAEPIIEKPRILEASPEEPPPLFGGISLAPLTLEEPGEDSIHPVYEEELPPLDVAPRSLRVVAGMTDLAVVVLATAVFALIFFQMTEATPQGKMAKLMALVVPALLWVVYHYVFLVHAASTPGMQLAGLHLSTFDGEPVPASTRRWRALALVMSCASAGLGFAWAAMDEDALCWHDRVTGTYLRQT